MKEAIIAFCTPDMNHPTARRAIEYLESTDLRRAVQRDSAHIEACRAENAGHQRAALLHDLQPMGTRS